MWFSDSVIFVFDNNEMNMSELNEMNEMNEMWWMWFSDLCIWQWWDESVRNEGNEFNVKQRSLSLTMIAKIKIKSLT